MIKPYIIVKDNSETTLSVIQNARTVYLDDISVRLSEDARKGWIVTAIINNNDGKYSEYVYNNNFDDDSDGNEWLKIADMNCNSLESFVGALKERNLVYKA